MKFCNSLYRLKIVIQHFQKTPCDKYFPLLQFQQLNTQFYPLNKRDIFTGYYFHTVKISKVLFSQCENNKLLLRRHIMLCMQCLRLERNMFKNQFKCNKQKILLV